MRKLLLIAALLLISTSAFSRKTQFGVKGGLNLANMSNSDGNYKPSIYAGLFVDVGLSDMFSIQPEVIYSRQGASDNEDGVKMWFQMDYVNVPIMMKIYIDNARKFSFDFGPQIGLLVSSKVKVKEGGNSITVDIKGLNILEVGAPKDIDFSVALGLSYAVHNKIDLTFRANIGVTKMFSSGTEDIDTANRVFQLGVGYRF